MTRPDQSPTNVAYQPFRPFTEWARCHVDRAEWQLGLDSLTKARRRSEADATRAVTAVIRASAFDTGAIEGLYSTDRGFTFSVALQSAAWEITLRARNDEAPELFAAQLRTYELVMDIATEQVPLTEVLIRRIHEEICAPQADHMVLTSDGWQRRPLQKGSYKVEANHVTLSDGSIHAYAPPMEVGSEMSRLVAETRSSEYSAAHPVLQAAYLHHALSVVHPFADGNGRVARALSSIFVARASSTPLLVLSGDRPAYFQALSAADGGDYQSFVNFISDRCMDGILLAAELAGGDNPPLPSRDELSALLGSPRLDALEALDGDAVHLREAVMAVLVDIAGRVELPTGARIECSARAVDSYRGEKSKAPPGWHFGGDPFPVLYVRVRGIRDIDLTRETQVLVADNPDLPIPYRLHSGPDDDMPFRARDFRPVVSGATDLRLRIWAHKTVTRAVVDFREALQGSM